MKSPRPWRFFWIVLIGAGFGLVAVSAFFAWQFTSPARRLRPIDASQFISAYETVNFSASDGVQLAGWFVPCSNAKCAVVLLHGHGSLRTQMLARARLLHDNGYAVLLYDARGHGESDGRLVSFGWFETRDLLGALNWLRTRGFTEFGCIGASQGGATIALAASQLKDVRWVVLESVYPTLKNAIDRRFRYTIRIPGWLAGIVMIPLAEWRLGVSVDDIAPAKHIGEIHCRVLVMNGDKDNYTQPVDARELFAHTREPRSFWLVPGAAHVDLYGFAKQDYERHLLSFIAAKN